MSLRANAGVLALALASCDGRQADLVLHDTAIVMETAAPFASRADFAERLESTISIALGYWGGDWTSLRGSTITLSGDAYVWCRGNASALGCYDGDIRVTTSDPGIGPFSCVEQTVLVHEIGHAVIGDPLHSDPRWMQLEPVQEALSGRTGYTPGGEVPCTIYVSVWRHPLGVP